MPIHLIKLAVGVRDLEHLSQVQAPRARVHSGAGAGTVIPVHTRQTPKRATDLLDGGSLYWVIRGAVLGRQRLVGLESGTDDEGGPCCRILVDPVVVPTIPTVHRPFQGWRYLDPAAAPADRTAADNDPLPAHLVAELRNLGLL